MNGKNGRRTLEALPSRNRAFDRYEDPEARRLMRARRLLQAIGRDLVRPGVRATLRARPVRVGRAERIRVDYELTPLRLSRTAYLTRDELESLRTLLSSSHRLIRWLED